MGKKLSYVVITLAILGLAGPAVAQVGKGNILIEEWINTNGAVTDNLDTLRAYSQFPDNPSQSYWAKKFDRPDGPYDNWGGRFRGYLYPPQTGDYTFWTCSDDDSELWLSTDDSPAKIKLICNVEGWMPYLAWDGTGGAPGTNFKSKPVSLQAGKKYYVEALWADGTGGGFQTVGWGGPGIGAGPVIIDGKYLSPVIRNPEPAFLAKNPSPADGTIGVSMPLMTWEAGVTAVFHNVYFGTDPNPPLASSMQTWLLYYHLLPLEPGVTYYWKVDEIEADGVTTHEGPVWTFVAQAETAYYPQPADGDDAVSPATELTWMAGLNASKHHLYLGEDKDAVTQGTPEVDKGFLTDPNFTPEALKGATTYHWRVDETQLDGTVQTGEVWSFTTYILVDEFETYNDDEGTDTRIYETWVDGWVTGNGATVGNWDPPFAERTIVHGGLQSMPFDYNNLNPPYYSEVYREFAPVQDWTVNGVTDLSLWVRGYAAMQTVAITETAGKMTLTGAGRDIWDNYDDFTFAYKKLSGNGSMVARVVNIGAGTNTWAKGGVMIRDSLNGGSTFVDMVMNANTDGTAGNGASFQWRPIADAGCTTADSATVVAPPYWVKIERTGDNISGFYSIDGSFWTQLGITQTIAMPAPVYIGICVTSHAVGEDRTFQFDNIKTTGGVSGNWQGAIISAPSHNSQQPLYVIVEDSTGKKATVPNPDPAAVNVADWTPWKIPLSDLAGVNLTKVKKLYLGVGDKSAVGNGKLYIDDIRVIKPAAAPEP